MHASSNNKSTGIRLVFFMQLNSVSGSTPSSSFSDFSKGELYGSFFSSFNLPMLIAVITVIYKD